MDFNSDADNLRQAKREESQNKFSEVSYYEDAVSKFSNRNNKTLKSELSVYEEAFDETDTDNIIILRKDSNEIVEGVDAKQKTDGTSAGTCRDSSRKYSSGRYNKYPPMEAMLIEYHTEKTLSRSMYLEVTRESQFDNKLKRTLRGYELDGESHDFYCCGIRCCKIL